MSKYKERGPYHYVEFCDEKTPYHEHVMDLVDRIDVKVKCHGLDFTLHEVGCGEGLILNLLDGEVGLRVSGNEADPEACRMAKLLLGSRAKVTLNSNITNTPNDYSAVLFADSLEHIETWKEHLEWAKQADYVIIAVPDQHDRHGLRDFHSDSFDQIFINWKCLHRTTRAHRHLTIWRNPSA